MEKEIHNSIFMSRDVGKRSIWTNRSFTEPPNQSPESLTPAEVEKSRRLQSLQNELKVSLKFNFEQRLSPEKNTHYYNSLILFQKQLVSNRILTFSVKWKDGGISSADFEHRKYLLDVSNQLSIHLRSAIDEIIEEESNKV